MYRFSFMIYQSSVFVNYELLVCLEKNHQLSAKMVVQSELNSSTEQFDPIILATVPITVFPRDTELEFTDQKNHNHGEKVGQYDSGHASASATKAIAEQVIHLRNNGASNDASLCSYMHNDQWYLVTPPMLTNLLRQAASRVGHKYGIAPADISA
ncbi:hypothetical protein THAOC_29256, partial [Thalassiosira oceanica]